MNESKEIEKILLNDTQYDALVNAKIEKEFFAELESGKNSNKKSITDIKKVSPDMIFSKFATYMIINKTSKTKSYINGMQAEGFLGVQKTARENLLKGISDSFVSDNNYIKFVKVTV